MRGGVLATPLMDDAGLAGSNQFSLWCLRRLWIVTLCNSKQRQANQTTQERRQGNLVSFTMNGFWFDTSCVKTVLPVLFWCIFTITLCWRKWSFQSFKTLSAFKSQPFWRDKKHCIYDETCSSQVCRIWFIILPSARRPQEDHTFTSIFGLLLFAATLWYAN